MRGLTLLMRMRTVELPNGARVTVLEAVIFEYSPRPVEAQREAIDVAPVLELQRAA